MILVEQAIEGSYCTVCGAMLLVYKIVVGNVSFYLCESCGERLHLKLEGEVIVPDVREW